LAMDRNELRSYRPNHSAGRVAVQADSARTPASG
jgi:hypothetical protein